MRKPRDFDAELQALSDKAKALKQRQREQLGELVRATGADQLDTEELAGALLAACVANEAVRKEWRASGAAFFRRPTRQPEARASRGHQGNAAGDLVAQSGNAEKSAS